MASSMFAAGRSSGGTTIPANVTRVHGISGADMGDHDISTEIRAQTPIRNDGTISNLNTYVTANSLTVTAVVTVRHNGADSAITVSYTTTQTGWKEDTTNSFIAATDSEVNYKVAVPAGAGTIAFTNKNVQFEPSNNIAVSYFIANGYVVFATASVTRYWNGGQLTDDIGTTENPCELLNDYTAHNFYTHVETNARSTDVVISVRKNSANGNQSLTYTAGQTGVKEDTVNTDVYVSGNEISYSMLTSTGVGNFTPNILAVILESEPGTNLYFEMSSSSSLGFSATTTYYCTPIGRLTSASTVGTQVGEANVSFSFTMTNFRVYSPSNSSSGSSTVSGQINGVATANLVTYTAAQTGLKTDTDTVSYSANSNFGYIISQVGTGTLTLTTIALAGYNAVGAAVCNIIQIING